MQKATLATFIFVLILPCCFAEEKSDLNSYLKDFFSTRNPGYTPVSPGKALVATWTVQKDEFGIQLHVKGATFERVTETLNNLLGKPNDTSLNVEGKRHWGYYPQKNRKVHLQVIDEVAEVYIVCVAPKIK